MSEKMSEVYEEYDVEIQSTDRSRGAIVLRTDKGIYSVSPLQVSEVRLKEENQFKEGLKGEGFENIDHILANKEGELLSWDRYGNPFVVRNYYEGRECSATNLSDLERGAENLARLHHAGQGLYLKELKMLDEEIIDNVSSPEFEDELQPSPLKKRQMLSKKINPGNLHRKNQELKKVRSYISKRSVKNEFEYTYIKAFNYFYDQAQRVIKDLEKYSSEIKNTQIGYLHGSYNYHSIIFCDGYMATINFEKFHIGYQLVDLYQYLRKVLEKNNYSFEYVKKIISRYEEIESLGADGYRFIYIMFSYPEKFWKVSNRYINSKKCWISPVLMEKLVKVIEHEQEKQKFLRDFSHYFGLHK